MISRGKVLTMSGGSLGESCNLKALSLSGWDVIVVVQSIPALYAPTAYSNRADMPSMTLSPSFGQSWCRHG
jgi:hypothetical protein